MKWKPPDHLYSLAVCQRSHATTQTKFTTIQQTKNIGRLLWSTKRKIQRDYKQNTPDTSGTRYPKPFIESINQSPVTLFHWIKQPKKRNPLRFPPSINTRGICQFTNNNRWGRNDQFNTFHWRNPTSHSSNHQQSTKPRWKLFFWDAPSTQSNTGIPTDWSSS